MVSLLHFPFANKNRQQPAETSLSAAGLIAVACGALALGLSTSLLPLFAAEPLPGKVVPRAAGMGSHPIAARGQVSLKFVGSYRHSDGFGTSAAEITAYDAATRRLFVVNVEHKAIDVLDLSTPAQPVRTAQIDVSSFGIPTSVTAKNGSVVAAVTPQTRDQKGHVLFIDPESRKVLTSFEVGYEPDCVALTPDGKLLVVANEGSPTEDHRFDPEGTISLIELPDDIITLNSSHCTTIDFRRYNGNPKALGDGARIFGPGATVAQDLEPEYISISADSRLAWISLQENNAVATIDLQNRSLKSVKGLGFKNHALPGHGFDASDKDGAIRIQPWPVLGLYQPDGVANYISNGRRYIVTANDGKDRDSQGYTERAQVGELKLDPRRFPQADELKRPENLGRLRVSKATGDLNGDGLIDALHAFGGRSFSIWDEQFRLVFDSGDQFERIIAQSLPEFFNSDHEEHNFDGRSAAKGPEPESVVVTTLGARTIAVICLERQSGLLVYDVTNPKQPVFEQFVNTRDLSAPAGPGTGGDLGPEGLLVIPADQSPTGQPLLVVANEISNTTALYEILMKGNK